MITVLLSHVAIKTNVIKMIIKIIILMIMIIMVIQIIVTNNMFLTQFKIDNGAAQYGCESKI